MTLTEFLLARLAADEALARRAHAEPIRKAVYQSLICYSDDVVFTSAFGPARVLAECEAKRRIVQAHQNIPSLEDQEDGVGPDCPDCWQPQPCNTIRILALPYADHPDFDPTWTLPSSRGGAT